MQSILVDEFNQSALTQMKSLITKTMESRDGKVRWDLGVEGKDRFKNTYTSLKVCVECVTSLVTKVTSDDVTIMT